MSARSDSAHRVKPNAASGAKSLRRSNTEAKLIAATRETIARHGFDSIGVNQIAERAGVPKQLIYRYFGSLEGLIQSAIEAQDFWLPERLEAFLASIQARPLDEQAQRILKGHLASLRGDPESREIRRFEMASSSPLAAQLAGHREQGGRMVTAFLSDRSDIDPAVFGIVLAGISYLVLRERTLATYIGIGIRGDKAWQRWEEAAQTIIRMACASPQPPHPKSKARPAPRKRAADKAR
ncbi:MAG: TetR/AcrR family transcriptional regulator [Burkholderiales bacterium]